MIGSERLIRDPRTTVTTTHRVDGIVYRVHKTYDERGLVGSVLDSPCHCLGSRMCTHSAMDCPWLAKRKRGQAA